MLQHTVHMNISHSGQYMSKLMMSGWVIHDGRRSRRQIRSTVCHVMVDLQVDCGLFYFAIRLQIVIPFCSLKTFGECESWALELSSVGRWRMSLVCSQGFREKVRCGNCWKACSTWQTFLIVQKWIYGSREKQQQQQQQQQQQRCEESGFLRVDTCLSGVSVMSDAQCEGDWATLRVPEYHQHHMYLSTTTILFILPSLEKLVSG